MNRKNLFILVPLISVFFISLATIPVSASMIDDVINGVKQIAGHDDKKEDKKFTIESKVELAPDGDIERNGEIDAGDIVRFTYVVTNTTDNGYKYSNINTGIDRTKINFIHNVIGTTGLNDDGKTIVIANVRLSPQQILTASFDARINYFQDKDVSISTEPEFFSEDKVLVVKAKKQEIVAKKIDSDKVKSLVESKKKE